MAVCEDAGFFDGEEPPIIVGHSFGGFITILTGALYGERLAGTVIVDSPVNPPDRPGGPPNRQFRPHRIYPTLEAAMERFRLAPPQPCENRYIVDYIARHSLKQVANPEGGMGWTWKFDPAIWQRFNIGDMVREIKAGRIEFRNDKTGVVHGPVGKASFAPEKIAENVRAFIKAVEGAKPDSAKGTYLRSVYLTTTMGPSIKVSTTTTQQ